MKNHHFVLGLKEIYLIGINKINKLTKFINI